MNLLRRFVVAILVGLGTASLAHARPLITQDIDPLGKNVIEVQTSLSLRIDEFGPDDSTYRTTQFPIIFKFGAMNKLDLGMTIQGVNHSLEQPGVKLKGSEKADFSVHAKYAFTEHLGIMGFFYQKEGEDTDDDIPIGHGTDLELLALFKWASDHVAFNLNSGFLWRGRYTSQFGVRGATPSDVEPGAVFETRGSMEIPMRWGMGLLLESAYYHVSSQRINGDSLENTSGDVWDGFAGLTWAKLGWNLGAGVGTSFLDERLTSFDLTHGMGDVYYKMALAYKFKPRRPDR